MCYSYTDKEAREEARNRTVWEREERERREKQASHQNHGRALERDPKLVKT